MIGAVSVQEEMRNTKEFVVKENKEFINFLFSKGILIPITEDFLRYHKDTEKYDEIITDRTKNRDNTKIILPKLCQQPQ